MASTLALVRTQASRSDVPNIPLTLAAATAEEALIAAPARILIADDDDGFRTAMVAWLKRCGYTVDQVSSGSQALVAWQKALYDVVILDICMQDGNGNDVARVITALDPLATLAFITGGTAPGESARCFEFSDGGCAHKPLDLVDFKTKLERLVIHNRNRRDAAHDDRRWHRTRPLMSRVRARLRKWLKMLFLMVR